MGSILVKQSARTERQTELAVKQQALPKRRDHVIYADPRWRFEPYCGESEHRFTPPIPLSHRCDRRCSFANAPSIAANGCALSCARRRRCWWKRSRLVPAFCNKYEPLLVVAQNNFKSSHAVVASAEATQKTLGVPVGVASHVNRVGMRLAQLKSLGRH